jgi:hypothetical protein
MNIGYFILLPFGLVNLASISPQAMSAAANLACYPWVKGYILVDVVGPILPIPATTKYTRQDEIRDNHYQLGCATFTALNGGNHMNMLGFQPGNTSPWRDALCPNGASMEIVVPLMDFGVLPRVFLVTVLGLYA